MSARCTNRSWRGRRLALAPLVIRRLALGLLLIMWRVQAAQAAFEVRDQGWEGTSGLLQLARSALGHSRVKVVAELDFAEIKPSDGVLVLHPEVSLRVEAFSSFLAGGGRVALLDDFGTASDLFERFGLRRIPAPLHPKEMLSRNRNLPVAIPATTEGGQVVRGRHPIVANVDRLFLNHPSALGHPGLTPVLSVVTTGGSQVAVAVVGVVGNERPGRLFAMSDPSAIINLMLRYPGNREFALGLVRYLVEDDSWGRRGGRLFIVANDFGQVSDPAGSGTTRLGFRDSLERLERAMKEGFSAQTLWILAILVGFVVLHWSYRHGIRRMPRRRPRYTLPTPLVAQGGWPGRAAVLMAPTTHRALPLLELKAGLEERLACALELDPSPSPESILETVRTRALLAPDDQKKLSDLLLQLGRVERRVSSHQSFRLSSEQIAVAHRRALDLLNRLIHRLEHPS